MTDMPLTNARFLALEGSRFRSDPHSDLVSRMVSIIISLSSEEEVVTSFVEGNLLRGSSSSRCSARRSVPKPHNSTQGDKCVFLESEDEVVCVVELFARVDAVEDRIGEELLLNLSLRLKSFKC